MKKMKLIGYIFAVTTLIAGCSSRVEREFMAGCTSGIQSPILKEACECTFSQMVKKYGDEETLEKYSKDPNKIGMVAEDMILATEHCSR